MQKIWKVKPHNPQLQVKLSNALRIHPIVAQLLINRGITDIQEASQFLNADLSRLHDPMLFKDMDKVLARINEAKAKKQKVLVFGDYDVDGVISSALMNQVLSEMGLDVLHHIPHRLSDGYGLNMAVADYVKEHAVDLLITVDCGITAIEEVKAISDVGVDVIIVDHHEPSEEGLPNAVAIINPKQADCPYPFKELASVGLVTKLIQALKGSLDEALLDLTALGTVADVVPLRGENRIFVKQGLPQIEKTKNHGLKALMRSAKVDNKKLSPFHIGFILGPRINAAGRMDTAHTALDLFLASSSSEAAELAKELEGHNKERQKLQRSVVQEAMEQIENEVNFSQDRVIVLQKEGWHKGVLGIVASRVTDKYYRPSIVISIQDGIGTASCRSIDGFHLHKALENCSEVLENFGGHEGAAGLTIKEENIEPFRSLINRVAEKTLEIKKLKPIIDIDCEIPLMSATLELADTVETLQPFGRGNPTPVFSSRGLKVKSHPQVLGRETLKFWVTQGDISISAVGFGMAEYANMIRPGTSIDLAYELSIDDWNKAPQAQLKLKDIVLSE